MKSVFFSLDTPALATSIPQVLLIIDQAIVLPFFNGFESARFPFPFQDMCPFLVHFIQNWFDYFHVNVSLYRTYAKREQKQTANHRGQPISLA